MLAEGWLRGVEWSGTRWLEVGDRGRGDWKTVSVDAAWAENEFWVASRKVGRSTIF